MKVLYIPLDERPCNLRYPQDIADINQDIELIVPPIEILGLKKQKAKVDQVIEFINNNFEAADVLICSIDMLCYGGLIPSRLHHDQLSEISSRLELINQIKAVKPELKIYGFSSIMRTPGYSSSDEEPDYYQEYGYEIFKTKYLTDKAERSKLTDQEQAELDSLKPIPEEIVADYETRRQVNNDNLLEVLNLLSLDLFERLVIFQDDSAPYGYTAIDQKKIKSQIIELELDDQVYIYPGADEVGCSLLLRAYNDFKALKPTVYCEYASTLATTLTPLYEDRPMYETLKHHLSVTGSIITTDENNADYILMLNSPGKTMQESWDQFENKNNEYDSFRNLKYFVEKIEYFVNRGHKVMIADVAYANGGDLELINLLDRKDLLSKVYGYAGWNTHANTLGTVLAMGMITPKHNKQTLRNVQIHVLEDGYYQAQIRMDVTRSLLPELDLNYFDLKDKQEQVIARELELLEAPINKLRIFENINCGDVKLSHPWNRMFEVDLQLDKH